MAGVEAANALSFQNSTGLTSPNQTITFDEFVFPQDTSITNQYSSLGVTFSPNLYFDSFYQTAGFPNISSNALINFELNNATSIVTPFSILFAENQSAAAFSMVTDPGTSTFTALLDGSTVESFSAATDVSISNNFYGFTDIVFDEIRVAPGGNLNSMALDNLQTGSVSAAVPFEFSPSLGLLLVGSLFGSKHLYRKYKASKVVLITE